VASSRRVLLIIGGGIAAYKCLDLIRRLRERGLHVRVVMTAAAQHFVTPLSVGALTNERVFTDLFDLDDEREIGHIRLARDCDCVVVAPATADLMSKMVHGLANDLATAVLLATDKPIIVAPAMNPRMWLNAATVRNTAQLIADGVTIVGPGVGEMAERNEAGPGRLVDVPELIAAIESQISALPDVLPLTGRHVLVTSGPTHEPIDPVRFIANRSSGKQGHALAAAAAKLGARVTLVSGPVSIAAPTSVHVKSVETAEQMLAAVTNAMPADIAIFAAAVADWRVAEAKSNKIKKGKKAKPPSLKLVENPDILRTIAQMKKGRPSLVIGFAAETSGVVKHAKAKLEKKRADWIVANDVSRASGVMGGDRNTVHVVSKAGVDSWPTMGKDAVAERLMLAAAAVLAAKLKSK
jgi:phosphopantothenoylcysteine decarboxylase / phosphopantothenate---cysteine ligase